MLYDTIQCDVVYYNIMQCLMRSYTPQFLSNSTLITSFFLCISHHLQGSLTAGTERDPNGFKSIHLGKVRNLTDPLNFITYNLLCKYWILIDNYFLISNFYFLPYSAIIVINNWKWKWAVPGSLDSRQSKTREYVSHS